MKDMHDFDSDTGSVHDFNDELLLALEKSGKTLVEIQRIILPWGNEKSEDMVTVGDKQYRNDDKGYPNVTQKKDRVRELLNATFAAKEQAHAVFKDIAKELEKAKEDKKASGTRYKYLADVAKRQFGVITSNKRKFASDPQVRGGGVYDYRPKKRHYDDYGEDDEEDFSAMKAELPKEEVMDGVKLEGLDGNRLKRPKAGLLRRDWTAPTIKHEPQSESQGYILPDYFPKKREPSEGPRVSPVFQSTAGRQQIRRRSDEYIDFGENTSSRRITETSREEEEDELKNQQFADRFSVESSPLGAPFRRTEAYPTPSLILHTLQTVEDITRTGRYASTTTVHTTRKDSHLPLDSSRTSSSKPASPEADGFINDLSEMWSSNVVELDTALLKANEADFARQAPIGLDAGGPQTTNPEADELNNAISDTNDSGSAPPKSHEYDAAELADSDDDEEVHKAVYRGRHETFLNSGDSDPGSSDAINPATVGSDVSDSGAPDASPVAHKYSTRRIRVNYEDSWSGASSRRADSDSDTGDSHGMARGDEVGTSSVAGSSDSSGEHSIVRGDEVGTSSDSGSSDSRGEHGSSSEASNSSEQTLIELSPDDEWE